MGEAAHCKVLGKRLLKLRAQLLDQTVVTWRQFCVRFSFRAADCSQRFHLILDEDIPGFTPADRAIANLLGDTGAGCAINGDRELNGDEGDYGGEVDGV